MRVVAAAIALLALQVDTTRPAFSEWLAQVRQEALARGIREEIVAQTLDSLEEPLPVVLQRDRSQAEAVLSLEQYISRILTRKMITTGREKFDEQRAVLDAVAAKYGVPARIIAGVWGVESNFGRFSGIRPTIGALATLAWDPRRSTFFRAELFDALEILNRGDIEPAAMKGSWAGAMGQVQFMPSSYLQYAEDFDGDGRKDIWSTPADIFASAANYLKGHGWSPDHTWGREVSVPPEALRRIRRDVALREGRCRAVRDMTEPLMFSKWRDLGVRLPNGRPLPAFDLAASLVSGRTKHFLVYPNYNALLEYNCSHSYALTVALLGDAVATKPAVKKAQVQ